MNNSYLTKKIPALRTVNMKDFHNGKKDHTIY